MDAGYPFSGFHFSVAFQGFNKSAQDVRFQSVSGLSAQVQTEEWAEGGENRFVHKLPTAITHEDLDLKRGMVADSEVLRWCRDAIEDFRFAPANVVISLLNEAHEPVSAWHVVHAIPTQWSVSEFDAQRSEIVVETLRLSYHYFTRIATD